jgi:photosystem II stability/assembly factor-like uncharacterized protein
MESEDELPSRSSTSRVPRALIMIVVSIFTIVVAGIAYLNPSAWFDLTRTATADNRPISYQLAAVDFVTPSIGWVALELPPRNFVVLRTADAGESWTRQLAGLAGQIGEYVRFFDPARGVVVLLGPQAVLYQTRDGGGTWSRQELTVGGGYVWSADFVDADHGWLLVQGGTEGQSLLRTADGGGTWTALGNPVLYSDWAYRVVFANSRDGWLYSQSTEPYAYKSTDSGTTWIRVALPAPPGGWPSVQGGSISTGEFFIAAHPTQGAGVMTTVVSVAARNGRARVGGVLLGYPPLRVSTYDGGRPIINVYANVGPYRYSSIERVNPGPFIDTAPVKQFHLSSVDGGISWNAIFTPSTFGAVGYVDASNWWWIGSGAASTSSDAGVTWTETRNLGVPEPLPGSLQFIDATHAWFGAMAGTRPLVETTDDGGVRWTMILLPAIAPR